MKNEFKIGDVCIVIQEDIYPEYINSIVKITKILENDGYNVIYIKTTFDDQLDIYLHEELKLIDYNMTLLEDILTSD